MDATAPIPDYPQKNIVDPISINGGSPLLDLIDVIATQLKYVKSQSPKGFVLNDTIQHTHEISGKLREFDYSVLSADYLKEYQRTLLFKLEDLNKAEIQDGFPSNLNEHLAVFYDLFKYMDHIVSSIKKGKLKGVCRN